MDTNRTLTITEYSRLAKLFEACDYAHPDDLQLFEQGDHRNLYDYIRDSLRMPCPAGRGPVYHYAAQLLNENKTSKITAIFECLKSAANAHELLPWAGFLLGVGIAAQAGD